MLPQASSISYQVSTKHKVSPPPAPAYAHSASTCLRDEVACVPCSTRTRDLSRSHQDIIENASVLPHILDIHLMHIATLADSALTAAKDGLSLNGRPRSRRALLEIAGDMRSDVWSTAQAYQLEVPALATTAPLTTIHSAEKINRHLQDILPNGDGIYQPPPGLTANDVFPFATAQKALNAASRWLPSDVWATEQ